MLIGTRKRLPELHHHTVYFSQDYPKEFSEIFDQREFPVNPRYT